MWAAEGEGPFASEVWTDSGDEKAKGDDGRGDDVWRGDGGGAVRETEEGEVVTLSSERHSSIDFCSLDDS